MGQGEKDVGGRENKREIKKIKQEAPAAAAGYAVAEVPGGCGEQFLREYNCPFALYVGTKKLVKRKEFEDFVSRQLVI